MKIDIIATGHSTSPDKYARDRNVEKAWVCVDKVLEAAREEGLKIDVLVTVTTSFGDRPPRRLMGNPAIRDIPVVTITLIGREEGVTLEIARRIANFMIEARMYQSNGIFLYGTQSIPIMP